MQTKPAWMRKLLLALLLLAAPSLAETIVIKGARNPPRAITLRAGDHLDARGTGNQLQVDGQGGSLELHGEGNEIQLKGSASQIEVHGNNNRLNADASIEAIHLHGVGNQVKLITRRGRPGPAVNKHGKGNSLVTEAVP